MDYSFRIFKNIPLKFSLPARVAKLVDAHASEACKSNLMEVQILSRAPS